MIYIYIFFRGYIMIYYIYMTYARVFNMTTTTGRSAPPLNKETNRGALEPVSREGTRVHQRPALKPPGTLNGSS